MKMAAKRKPDQVVRCFEVSNPTLHEKGHTIYKITQRLIRVDKQEEDVQEVSVWRRYNDIKHLYKAMHKLHTALHRKDEFPPFAEAKLFGRFDEDVIIERMRSAQDLLNFVGQRHYMVSHAAFKRFFEGGEQTKSHEAGEKLLKPQRVSKLSGDSDSDVSLSPTHKQGTAQGTAEGTTQGTAQGIPLVPEQAAAIPKDQSVELGGVWQYRQTGEDEELSLDGEEEENTEENTDTDSIISTPLPTDTKFFDPLTAQTPPGEEAVSNLWLLSSLQEEESPEPAPESISFQVGADGVEYGKGDLLVSPVPEACASLPQNASPRRLAKPSSLLNLDLQDKGDYIVQAAKQISLAQHCEASNNYHLAFSYYKNGVGILLTGVQLDENETRREVVRRKTARYLIKAEEIHKQHLSQNLSSSSTRDTATHPNNRWDTGQLSPARELDPAIALLQGSFSELRNFKVLGILDSVMLVMDVNTENTFVIKVLQKSVMDSPTTTSASSSTASRGSSAVRRCLVRARGPCMVELYRFYDSADVVYLLLQHAAGGRLWNYVGHFLQDHAAAIHELADVYDDQKRLRSHTFDTEEGEEVNGNREGVLDESKAGEEECSSSNNNANSRAERLDSALEDVGSVVLDKDTVTIDQQLQHVQFDAAKDNDLLHPDSGSIHSGGNIHSGSQLESQIVEETESELNNTFQSLLEHTRKQALVAFAVDSSFESEDPPSRQLSNTIDSIEEEPTQSQEPTHLVDNVFITGSHEDGVNTQASVRHSEDSEEEPSIYDNQPPYISDSDSETVTLNNGASQIHKHNTGSNTREVNVHTHTHTKTSNSGDPNEEANTFNTPSAPERSTAMSEKLESIPESGSDITTSPTPPTVFRQVSRERSADSRRRKRTLSGAFAELDLAGEEETESKQQKLPEPCVRQWMAELVVAVDALHQSGIICRDLNPANLLLGDRGHLLLSHFSVWSSVEPTDPDTDSGYVAPEVSSCRPLSPACDWWSVGALLYELLVGKSLALCHPAGMSTHSSLYLPAHLSPEAGSLLTQLLRVSPAERLTVLDIKTHAFFKGVDWHELEKY